MPSSRGLLGRNRSLRCTLNDGEKEEQNVFVVTRLQGRLIVYEIPIPVATYLALQIRPPSTANA